MSRPTRKALLGYRVADANRYLEDLESHLAEQEQRRQSQLDELRTQLKASETLIEQSEVTLKSLQATYFRLSGELSTLTVRAQEMMNQARESFDVEEQKLWNIIEENRAYSDQLQKAIQMVPTQIRAVIEALTDPVLKGVPESQDSGYPAHDGASNISIEARALEGGRHA